MQELIELLIKQLVDDPNNVDVEINDNLILIKVEKTEIGRVIGKQGRIARAIRAIVKASSMKKKVRFTVEIEER